MKEKFVYFVDISAIPSQVWLIAAIYCAVAAMLLAVHPFATSVMLMVITLIFAIVCIYDTITIYRVMENCDADEFDSLLKSYIFYGAMAVIGTVAFYLALKLFGVQYINYLQEQLHALFAGI